MQDTLIEAEPFDIENDLDDSPVSEEERTIFWGRMYKMCTGCCCKKAGLGCDTERCKCPSSTCQNKHDADNLSTWSDSNDSFRNEKFS